MTIIRGFPLGWTFTIWTWCKNLLLFWCITFLILRCELLGPRQVCYTGFRVWHWHSWAAGLHLAILQIIALVLHSYPFLSRYKRPLRQSVNNLLVIGWWSIRHLFPHKDVTNDVSWIVTTAWVWLLIVVKPSLTTICSPFEHLKLAIVRDGEVIIRAFDLEVISWDWSKAWNDGRWFGLFSDRGDSQHGYLLSLLRETTFYALYFPNCDSLPSK